MSYFERAAEMELASALAFEWIANQLRRLGASASLIACCQRAEADERNHARMVTSLARQYGSRDELRLNVAPIDDVNLVDFLIDNATSGCVGETWSALEARLIAQHALDANVRQAFTQIANDEADHADLAWAIADELEPRLTASERARVRQARIDALASLRLAIPTDVMHLPHTASARLSESFQARMEAYAQ